LWRVLPAQTPPLYDGVCVSDPYRLLGASPAPQSYSKTYPAEAPGQFPIDELTTNPTDDASGETPPQAQILLTNGTFVSPTPFTVSITPVAPSAAAPSNFALNGNVYRVAAVTKSGQVLQPQPQHEVTVILRATSSSPPKSLYVYNGSTWVALQTLSTGGCGDSFEATSTVMGDFALFLPTSGSSAPQPGSGGVPVIPIIIGLAVVLLLTIGGLVYLNRGVQ